MYSFLKVFNTLELSVNCTVVAHNCKWTLKLLYLINYLPNKQNLTPHSLTRTSANSNNFSCPFRVRVSLVLLYFVSACCRMSYIILISSLYHPYIILILSLYYPYIILISSLYYPYIILILSLYYPYIILISSLYYPYIILISSLYHPIL